MPTGYTAAVGDGKVTAFSAFALQCARNFGALITMRDEDMNAPIPQEFEPDDYNRKAAQAARDRLQLLEGTDDAFAEQQARQAFADAVVSRERYSAERAEVQRRYEAMLRHVENWQPPTPDHAGLKKFMREQLQESIRFDCSFHDRTEPVLQSGPDWKREQIAKCIKDIAYHEQKHADEVRRTNERNAWVKALRESLE